MGRFCVSANSALRNAVLFDVYDAPYAGHMGVEKTYERLHHLYWWMFMKQDVHTYVTHCDQCQRNEPLNVKAPVLQWLLPSRHGSHV
jgi:hypothetical protein